MGVERISRYALSITSRQCFFTAGICFSSHDCILHKGEMFQNGEIILVTSSYSVVPYG